jgi:hypothetical protein
VINVGMLANIRRMHFRDKLSLREIARRSGLSRNKRGRSPDRNSHAGSCRL